MGGAVGRDMANDTFESIPRDALVQAQGGRIWAESPGPGAGATFAFVLPAAP